MHFYNVFFLSICIFSFFLAGCVSNLQQLQEISPDAGNFNGSLAAEYLAYSESEVEEGNAQLAEHFASKGIQAAKGKPVAPDMVNVNNKNYHMLSHYRLELVEILRDDVKRVVPQKSARAQILFDCWNEQESRNVPKEEASCAEEFALAFDELQLVSDNLIYGADNKNVVKFRTNSVELDVAAKYVIAKTAARLMKHPDYMLALKIHPYIRWSKTDKNRLEHKRLEVVRDALLKFGVPKEKIVLAKFNLMDMSDSKVYLSNDEIIKNRDNVYIAITSLHDLPVVEQ